MFLELDEGYQGHRKTIRLCGVMQNPEADVFPVRLWQWAVRSAPDGDLSQMESYDVETAVRYRPLDGKLYAALVHVGFIDVSTDGVKRIHNWRKRTGGALQRMETRAQELREFWRNKKRKQRALSPACPPDVPPMSQGHVPALSPPCPPPKSSQVKSSQVQARETEIQSVSLTGNPPPAKALPKLKRRITPKPEPAYGESFERIWSETGRSGNKFPAFEAWLANGSPPADDVIEGWRHAQRNDRRWKGSDPHIPHLATWLNDLGWQDRPTLNGSSALRTASPAEQIQAIQAKEREAREYRRRMDEMAEQVAAQAQAALRGVTP